MKKKQWINDHPQISQDFLIPYKNHDIAIYYINIEVSCKCKRPDLYQDMNIECDKWYHLNCARLTTIPKGD